MLVMGLEKKKPITTYHLTIIVKLMWKYCESGTKIIIFKFISAVFYKKKWLGLGCSNICFWGGQKNYIYGSIEPPILYVTSPMATYLLKLYFS